MDKVAEAVSLIGFGSIFVIYLKVLSKVALFTLGCHSGLKTGVSLVLQVLKVETHNSGLRVSSPGIFIYLYRNL